MCKKSGRIRIFHSTIVELENPQYIRFLLNLEKKALAIQSCRKNIPESFRVPQYDPERWDFVVHSISVLRMIWRTCGWEDDKTYRMDGIYYAEHRLEEFDLNQAEIISFDKIENM